MIGPHQGQPVASAGAPLTGAHAAMVMIHGRGASAESILTLVPELGHPEFAYLAPNASGGTWYPYGFMAPIASNEPGISSGIQAIGDLLDRIEEAGIPREQTILLGFSQGACLTLEFTARHTRRYGGVAGLSGGVIGPEGTPRNYEGSLDGTPIFLGCSDVDSHIPKERVELTAALMQRLGAEVTMRLYPGMGHTINEEEIAQVRGMMDGLLGR
jgi:predicted esterase